MVLSEKSTICDIIVNFMESKKDAVASLKEIYAAVKGKWQELKQVKCPAEETIRAAIYKAPKRYNFERIGKGLYLLKGDETAGLLIHGDSRKLEEIDNEAIDCIITDHPWSDKKAHKSGNQKCFADYETFEYTLEDFKTKSRVLKKGSFLAEFLPVESSSNWRYLNKIKELATEAGFEYYAQMIWRNAPEGAINTGRTTKGVQQIIIFSKGKPRRLSPKGKPYCTTHMLSYELDIPANKGKDKKHQAEKPIPVYEYLLEQLTEEKEVCLDQFGGSCNLLKAATNKKRWAVVYEKCENFTQNAVKNFDLYTIFKGVDNQSVENKSEDIKIEKQVIEIETIPATVTDFQIKHLINVSLKRPDLLTNEDKEKITEYQKDIYSFACDINKLFNEVNFLGYKNYKKNLFNIDLEEMSIINKLKKEIDLSYIYGNKYVESYYINYEYELEMLIEYSVVKRKISCIDSILTESNINSYINYLKNNNIKININRTHKILSKLIKGKKNIA